MQCCRICIYPELSVPPKIGKPLGSIWNESQTDSTEMYI
ncbi:unnamed protein product [Acanthoscelides obtectus]|uniref:Uncharacterized protein n=1 Tax=Acanthoscelides obtectus TaxID=200917 RepID=A0A9P0JVT0_ACAOB|nr:unnamed protein product [Acanthoscelides obtectus]CAK1621301.1 hypothetical protein AOBTE_LOCUS881 [Acanthoscelides obtectus]